MRPSLPALGARAAIVCLALGALACHVMPPPPRDATQATLEAYVRSFRRAEPILLESLSRSDPRFARRLRIAPPPRFTDPFAFDVRAIGLENVVLELARVTLPEWRGTEPHVLVEHRLEEELVYRLVLEEEFRLAHERDDVRAAAGLLSAIATAWPSPQLESDEGARYVDSVLAWRLAQVRGALRPFAISEAQREELRAAVDALDARAARAPLPRVRAELLRLRAAIAVAWAAPFATEEWDDVATALHAHLGAHGDHDALVTSVTRAAAIYRAQAEVGLGVIAAARATEVRRRAGAALHASTCRALAVDSVVRGLAPPAERTLACGAVQLAASAEDDLDELAALVVLHDVAVVGAWSLAMHGAVRDATAARARWPLMGTVSAPREAELAHVAAVRPIEAIGAALAAVLLTHEGMAHVVATARAWRAFGDAPFDVVERELFSGAPRRAPGRPGNFELVPDSPRRAP